MKRLMTLSILVLSMAAVAQTPKTPGTQYPPPTTAAENVDQAPLPPPPVVPAGGGAPTEAAQAPAPVPVPANGSADHLAPSDESTTQMARNLLSGIIEEYNYEVAGKRDPFLPYSVAPKQAIANAEGPVFPLQKFDLDQLKLIGIIWEIRTPKAMIIDPNGKGYIVRTNERLGKNNGYIAKIREGELVVVESFTGGDGKTSYQTKLVKLVQE